MILSSFMRTSVRASKDAGWWHTALRSLQGCSSSCAPGVFSMCGDSPARPTLHLTADSEAIVSPPRPRHQTSVLIDVGPVERSRSGFSRIPLATRALCSWFVPP